MRSRCESIIFLHVIWLTDISTSLLAVLIGPDLVWGVLTPIGSSFPISVASFFFCKLVASFFWNMNVCCTIHKWRFRLNLTQLKARPFIHQFRRMRHETDTIHLEKERSPGSGPPSKSQKEGADAMQRDFVAIWTRLTFKLTVQWGYIECMMIQCILTGQNKTRGSTTFGRNLCDLIHRFEKT